MKLLIDAGLAQQIATYLTERPYKEVAGILDQIKLLERVEAATSKDIGKAANGPALSESRPQ